MKRLILTRHAKSDWSSNGQTDHQRPLNPRGNRSAQAIGEWLRKNAYNPDLILCSDAVRTRETLIHMSLDKTPTTFTRDLYLAEPEVMQSMLCQQQEDCILMLAHNPGCAFLADSLVSEAPAHEAFCNYPTCATLIVDFDITRWDNLQSGIGSVCAFTVPRDLIE